MRMIRTFNTTRSSTPSPKLACPRLGFVCRYLFVRLGSLIAFEVVVELGLSVELQHGRPDSLEEVE